MGRRPGRPRKIDHTRTLNFSWEMPEGLGLALGEYAHVHRKRKTEVLRELLEKLLEPAGFLRVSSRKDEETGEPLIVYEALRRR